MMDITTSAAPAMITLEPGDDPETAWACLRDLGRASGLAPVRAARLALVVTTVAGQRCGPTQVEIARVEDAQGAHVEATIDGANATPSPAPPGLVDAGRRPISAARTVTWILPIDITEDTATYDPAWAELNDAAARSPDTRQLLLAVLAAVARQHADQPRASTARPLLRRLDGRLDGGALPCFGGYRSWRREIPPPGGDSLAAPGARRFQLNRPRSSASCLPVAPG